jgi:hypothetical protein
VTELANRLAVDIVNGLFRAAGVLIGVAFLLVVGALTLLDWFITQG